MDSLKEILKDWLHFKPDKRGPPQDVKIEPLLLEDEYHDDEMYFVIGMGEHDGTP